MTVQIVVGVSLIAIGLVTTLYGTIMIFRRLRYLPLRRTLLYAFLGPVFITLGLGIAIVGLFLFGSEKSWNFYLNFLLFRPLALLFGSASALGELLHRRFIDAMVDRGKISRAEAYPYDKSLKQ